MSRIATIATFLTFALTAPSLAETVTLDCKMTDLSRSGGWIPSISLIKVDTAQKTVQLLKPTPEQMTGRIKSAKLVRNSADKMILRWVLQRTKSKSNQTTPAFNFRASLDKTTGKASVIAKPLGYGNDFRAKGNCKIS